MEVIQSLEKLSVIYAQLAFIAPQLVMYQSNARLELMQELAKHPAHIVRILSSANSKKLLHHLSSHSVLLVSIAIMIKLTMGN